RGRRGGLGGRGGRGGRGRRGGRGGLGPGQRQGRRAAHHVGADAGELGRVGVDLPVRQAGEQLLERDLGLQAGQRRPQAVVDAVAEGQVALDAAVDVEA